MSVKLSFDRTSLSGVSSKELKRAARLLWFIKLPFFLYLGRIIELFPFFLKIPLIKRLIKVTIFRQFCGGTTLKGSTSVIEELDRDGIHVALDYAGEGFSKETEFEQCTKELINSVKYASTNQTVSIISMKVTGIARFELLQQLQLGQVSQSMDSEMELVVQRLDRICEAAHQNGVSIFVDAEESWIQNPIDILVDKMMSKYNKEKVIVFNTFQLYRYDRLPFLMNSYEKAQKGNYYLGAKLVRGAYMEKERLRAEKLNYPSPIHTEKISVDGDFNYAAHFCLDHLEEISTCLATHNQESCELMASLMIKKNLPVNHPHLIFCQLYGMCDWITKKLVLKGFNSVKYLPYGSVEELVPYLIRRARENSFARSGIALEYQQIKNELLARDLSSSTI